MWLSRRLRFGRGALLGGTLAVATMAVLLGGPGALPAAGPDYPPVLLVASAELLPPVVRVDVRPPGGVVASGAALMVAHSGGFARCTAGAAWRDGQGRLGVLTSAHCAQPGEAEWVSVLAGRKYRHAGRMSLVADQRSVDVAFIELHADVLPAPVVRTSGSSVQLERAGDIPVVGLVNASPGDRVCVLGTSTGLTCNWRVGDVDAVLHTSDGVPRPGTLAFGTADVCVSPGDSGGPVFVKSGANALLAGIVSAYVAGPLDAVTGVRECGVLFAPVDAVTAAIGGGPILAGS
jgi:hypothetical protein